MAKKNTVYKCSSCGCTQPAWLGRCPECGEWNTFEECTLTSGTAHSPLQAVSSIKQKPVFMSSVSTEENPRISTGSKEFDRVLGGGATLRSVILIGGEPGIGKSTLLIQSVASILKNNPEKSVLYVSGEESASQIKNRALRLKLNVERLKILCTLRLEDILDALNSGKEDVVIIDSIQTVFSSEAGIVPGTVNQLKYCANELIGWVKERDAVLFMTAHVTKEGVIAGPKSLEHMVDTVISFERTADEVRFLRSLKNRFGSVDELGIFEMNETGLKTVEDPSALFITRRETETPAGIACVPVFEGSRVFVVEIQALTVPAKSSVNRVYSEKIDSARVSRVAAVLEKKLGLVFSDQDIYVNVAGGVRLSESAIDSCLADLSVPSNVVLIGELSLAGEIRPVTKLKQRIKTSKEMGFTKVFVPEKDEEGIYTGNIKSLIDGLFSNRQNG